MYFLFSVSCCLSLIDQKGKKQHRDKQQETDNKEHIVELALKSTTKTK